MGFIHHKLEKVIKIDSIISIHYFEFVSGFIYDGESHDFWELVYADKGETQIITKNHQYTLRQGEIIFHKPDEYHNIRADKNYAPNVVIITFDCRSKHIGYLNNRIFTLDANERELLSMAVKEGMSAFAPPFDSPFINELKVRKDAPFGAQQLISTYLSAFLIHLVRRTSFGSSADGGTTRKIQTACNDHFYLLKDLLEDNICNNLTINEISRLLGIGKSQLASVCRSQTGKTVTGYYRSLKMEKAKSLIRSGGYTITQTAYNVGYDSIHSFTRYFKKYEGMSPSTYLKSVKAKLHMDQ